MGIPPCGDFKSEKYVQHVPNQSSHLSPTSMKELPEWLKKPIVKIHSSALQEDITIHNSSLEFDIHI